MFLFYVVLCEYIWCNQHIWEESVALWDPGFSIFQQEWKPYPLKFFQHYHICQHGWKTVGTTFQCLLFSNTGDKVLVDVEIHCGHDNAKN